MNPDELRDFEKAVINGIMPVYSPDKIAEWQRLANERETELNMKFAAANGKSDEICKQRKVQK